MITIKKVGRWGVFQDELPKKLESALFNRLAYQKEGWQFMPNKAWSWRRFYIKKKRCFPWGLRDRAVEILEEYRKQYGAGYIIDRDVNIKADLNFPPILRPYQRDAVTNLVASSDGVLSAPCGSGKTKIMINFLKLISFKRALIIVPTLFLKIQWQEQTLDLSADVMNFQAIKDLNILKKYDVLIIDECHTTPANTIYRIAMAFGEGRVYGCSATPYRNYRPEGMKIEAALGKIIYSISLSELIEKDYLCDAEVKLVNLTSFVDLELWDTYQLIYDKFIVENEERNNKIVEIALEQSKKGLTFITVEKIKHGQILFDMLNKHNNKVIFVKGKMKNREEVYKNIKEGVYDIVVTTKVFNLGVDFTMLKNLIVANGGKSAVRLIQQIGRVLRPHPDKTKAIIFDFADNVKYLKNHFEDRYEIYRQNFEVKYINGI